MGACLAANEENQKPISKFSETVSIFKVFTKKKFRSMDNPMRVVKSKQDIIVKPSSFVIEHSLTEKFSDHYILDPVLLGEGAYGRV